MGLSRRQLFQTLGIITDGPRIDPVIGAAYDAEERRLYDLQHDDTAVERKGAWHTAFHLSSFPGSEKECTRYRLYEMMNVPEPEPISQLGRSVMDMGRQLEYQIVYRLARAGKTISGSCPLEDGGPLHQTRFEVPELWTVGSTDMALDLRPEWRSVVVGDVKGKDHDVVSAMQVGVRKWDPEHYAQIQGYIFAAREFHVDMGWADMGLEPCDGGVLIYASRARPRHTKEFFFRYDEEFAMRAIERLHDAKSFFEDGVLPPREKEWRWTETPCDWCPFKKHACKPDIKADVTLLRDSKAIEFARSVNASYDYVAAREAVLDRWATHETAREEAA
jgi:hypothetical protein